MASGTPLPLKILTEQFAKLPGIGMKTAGRLAYHVMRMDPAEAESFAEAITNVHDSIHECKVCMSFTDKDICGICSDLNRDASTICVVEYPKDIQSFEATNEYHGTYHVLHGLMSPMDGVGADDLRITELLSRVTVGDNAISEVIMATSPTVEGEATAIYIAKLLKPFGVKVTRLALGIPVGASLEYTDSVTLFRALQNRNEL
ncbi:MAG: recombination mediator RecR [Ruminococcus sp.]|jgi:recombination protein RecR|nr:recombination mediator RecR [Ruminococcus sp.]